MSTAEPVFKRYGVWRVYYNRDGALGMPWCITEDVQDPQVPKWELAVGSVEFDGNIGAFIYRPKVTDDAEDGRPSAWVELVGWLKLYPGGQVSLSASAVPSGAP